MGVASLSYAESTFLLPHYGSRRGQGGGAAQLCLVFSFLQDRKTFSQGSSSSGSFLFSKNCFHVQTLPCRSSTSPSAGVECAGRPGEACLPDF